MNRRRFWTTAIAVAVLDAPMAGAMPSDIVGKLRNLCPGLRVVFLADPGFDLDKRYMQLGSQLRKPVNDERLLHAVMSALRLRSMTANVEMMPFETLRTRLLL